MMEILLANTVHPDQTPHNVASDLGLHCLPMALLRVSRQEWVNYTDDCHVHDNCPF